MIKITKLLSFNLFTILLSSSVYSQDFTPELILPTSDGTTIDALPTKKGIIVYEWFNPECPFVKKIYKNSFMTNLQEKYIAKGVKWFVVNSTNKSHRDFISKENRAELKTKMGIKNAIMVYDEDGEFSKASGAKTTPHIIVFKDERLSYSGAIDDSPETESDPEKAEKNYLKLALDALIAGAPVEKEKTRPYGCSIKH